MVIQLILMITKRTRRSRARFYNYVFVYLLLKYKLKKFIDNYQNEFIGHLIYKNEYTYLMVKIPKIFFFIDKLPEQLSSKYINMVYIN